MNKNLSKIGDSQKGALYVVSAPSGAGKTSLVSALVRDLPYIQVSISYTTRPKRGREQEGVDYHFVSQAEFKTMIENNVFLEYADVFGYYYGTSREWVEEQCANGFDVLLEIDWQGAREIRKQFEDTTSIFILPPTQEELKKRLIRRHQDSPEVIARRMKEAKEAISKYAEYDYLICNDNFEDALGDLIAIVRSRRLRLAYQQVYQAARLTELLS